jgi:hypothetical protein
MIGLNYCISELSFMKNEKCKQLDLKDTLKVQKQVMFK